MHLTNREEWPGLGRELQTSDLPRHLRRVFARPARRAFFKVGWGHLSNEMLHIPGASIDMIVTRVKKSKEGDESHKRLLIEACALKAFEDSGIHKYEEEEAFSKMLVGREQNVMSELMKKNQYFQKEIFSIPALRGREFKNVEEFRTAVLECSQLEGVCSVCDPLEFFEVKKTSGVKFKVEYLMNIEEKMFVSVLIVPCFQDTGCDFSRGVHLVNLDPSSSVKLRSFRENEKQYIKDENEKNNIDSFLVILFEIDFREGEMEIETFGFCLMPVKTPSESFLYGTYQIPILQTELSKEVLEEVSKINPWNLYASISSRKVRFKMRRGCVVCKIYPEELESFCELSERNELLNSMFLTDKLKSANSMKEESLKELKSYPVKCASLITQETNKPVIRKNVDNYFLTIIFNNPQTDGIEEEEAEEK